MPFALSHLLLGTLEKMLCNNVYSVPKARYSGLSSRMQGKWQDRNKLEVIRD